MLKEIGLRGGYTAGITFRVNLEENLSYEGQLGYRDQGAIFTVIRQQHHEMGMDRLGNWDFIMDLVPHLDSTSPTVTASCSGKSILEETCLPRCSDSMVTWGSNTSW